MTRVDDRRYWSHIPAYESRKAIEKVMNSKAVIEATGEPIEKGPWYNASLAVSHQRHSVSCSFSMIGPQGTKILHLKAVCNGNTPVQEKCVLEDSMFGLFQKRDWEISVPSSDGPQQTLRINVSDMVDLSAGTHHEPFEPQEQEKSSIPQEKSTS